MKRPQLHKHQKAVIKQVTDIPHQAISPMIKKSDQIKNLLEVLSEVGFKLRQDGNLPNGELALLFPFLSSSELPDTHKKHLAMNAIEKATGVSSVEKSDSSIQFSHNGYTYNASFKLRGNYILCNVVPYQLP